MNKKRKSLITAGIVVLIICLLSSISSAVIYDYKNIKIRQVTLRGDNFDPEWSPDGSQIVYASTEKGPNSCIWLVDPDGENRRMISQPESDYDYYEPTWSPDGSKIAFISHTSPERDYYICVMDSDGSNVTKITPRIRDLNVFNLKWSPDGSKITYDSKLRVSHQFCIWVIDSDGYNRTQLTTVEDTYNSTWSPDGSKIAYVMSRASGKEIWILDSDGSNKTRLMPQKRSAFEESFSYFHPTWNPDGTKIAFVTDRFSEYNYFDIAVLNLEDNSVTTLTDTLPRYFRPYVVYEGYEHFYDPGIVMEGYERGNESNPKWSPVGSKILFIGENDIHIWIMNSDSSDKILLVSSEYLGEFVFNPKWSPDESKILFERKYTGSWDIFVMTLSEAIIPATTPSPSSVATINISVTPTLTQPIPTPATPSPTLTPIYSPTPTPRLTPAPTATPTEFPTTEEKRVPGFEAVSAIVGLLAVTYLLRRR